MNPGLAQLAVVVLIGLANPTSPAAVSAGSVAPAAVDWSCAGHAQPPVPQSGIIRANAFQSCSGGPGWRQQRLVVEIQRRRLGMFWQRVASEDSGLRNEPFVERTVFYKCLGTGSYTYRTVGIGSVANGSYTGRPVPSLSSVDVTC